MSQTGIELIAKERQEQIEKHGRTIESDYQINSGGELIHGAEMLLASIKEEGIDSESYPNGWDKNICDNMLGKSLKQKLIIAGALIAAEIDRLNYSRHNG